MEPCSRCCPGPGEPLSGEAQNPRSGPTRLFSATLRGCSPGAHGGRGTVDQFEKLDIRLLRRAGALTQGATFEHDGIRGRNTGTRLVISWDARRREYAIGLLRTRCNYGGTRSWLQCPVVGCGRRVGVLYATGTSLACRRCCALGYRSQREDVGSRRLRQARKIAARLGMPGDLPFTFPKPKRMHSNTYDELRRHYLALLGQGLGLLDLTA